MYRITQESACFFALFCVLFIPFPFYIFSFQLQVADFIFGRLISMVSENIFGIFLKNPEISSDSTSMYLLILILFALSVLTSLLILPVKKWEQNRSKFFVIFYKIFSYYLALQLLKYGFDKIFKSQFYLPEPNILYTPLGQVSKDLLFWSSMGTSYFYNVFGGMLEVICAIFILFKRTRILGLLMAVGLMLNVVAINFGFDISVKIYSFFLLFLSLLLLSPQINRLYQFLILQKSTSLELEADSFAVFKNRFFRVSAKTFIIGMIFLEGLYPFVKTQNFNDDLAQRPYLHGAYEVKEITSGKDTIALNSLPIKRFFIHRNGYIIFQNHKDEMQDFKLDINRNKNQFLLTDYQLNQSKCNYLYHERDSILELQYFNQNKEYLLKAHSLDLKKLPALQNEFHWRVDGL